MEVIMSNSNSTERTLCPYALLVIAAVLCGSSACAAPADSHSLDLDVTGVKGALTKQESEVFDLDDARVAHAQIAIDTLDDELAAFEDPSAKEGLSIRVSLDGAVLTERFVPTSSARQAISAVQRFSDAVRPVPPAAEGHDGVAVQSAPLIKELYYGLLAWMYAKPDTGGGNGTIGVRG
jgi:hypothetical protein